jgi:hypothetical protein
MNNIYGALEEFKSSDSFTEEFVFPSKDLLYHTKWIKIRKNFCLKKNNVKKFTLTLIRTAPIFVFSGNIRN